MMDIQPFLKSILALPGLSGNEEPARQRIEETWRPLVDEISTSRLGSLHALRRGSGLGDHPRILLAAHMDAIGLMTTRIVDGLIFFTQVGGVDPRILPGQKVTVHGRQELPGIVVQPPARLLPGHLGDSPVPMEYLMVDTGLLPEAVEGLVRPGDLISFAQSPFEMTGDTICGHTLDNRASVAAVTVCLDELQRRVHQWDVWAVATTQEEVTMGGASTSAFEIRPDIAVAIDVTFAKGPGSNDHNTFGLGKGPTIAMGLNIHPALYQSIKETAEFLEIPFQLEVLARHSGTDAYAMQVAAEGIPTLVLGIPLRYMHTPVEVVSMKDIQRVGRLLAEWITRLDADFIKNITWDSAS